MQAGPSSVGRDAGQERLRTGKRPVPQSERSGRLAGSAVRDRSSPGSGLGHHGGYAVPASCRETPDPGRGLRSGQGWPPEDPFLLEAWAFGDVLRGADPLECVEVVIVVNLPPQEVVWGSSPQGTIWLADRLRLSKGAAASCDGPAITAALPLPSAGRVRGVSDGES